MMHFLVRRFIPGYEDTEDPSVRFAYGRLSGIVGIVLNLCLFAGKFICGLLSGAISIIADAFNNLSDAGSSIITLVGFRMAGQKADKNHPYGHGRIEYITGLIVSIVIIVVGIELARDSISKILHPEETFFTPLIALILLASIGVKLYMYLYNHSFAGSIHSVALSSTATDSRNDAITTAIVLLSQIFTAVTGILIDGWTGLAVAIFIIWSGIGSCKDTISPLIGQEPDPELVRTLEQVVENTPDVLGVHDLLIHDYGPGNRMMSLHIEVRSDMSLLKAHEIADAIETRMWREYSIHTVIHVDPRAVNDPETDAVSIELNRILKDLGSDCSFHDLRIVGGGGKRKILFDVSLPYDDRHTDDEIREYFRRRFAEYNPSYRLILTVDHHAGKPAEKDIS